MFVLRRVMGRESKRYAATIRRSSLGPLGVGVGWLEDGRGVGVGRWLAVWS